MKIITTQDASKVITLKLTGELDANGCTEIREKLEDIIASSADKTLFLDLLDVNFIDSSGIGAMVFLYKRLRAINANLKIINVRGQPQELLSLLRVHEAIPVVWYTDNENINQQQSKLG